MIELSIRQLCQMPSAASFVLMINIKQVTKIIPLPQILHLEFYNKLWEKLSQLFFYVWQYNNKAFNVLSLYYSNLTFYSFHFNLILYRFNDKASSIILEFVYACCIYYVSVTCLLPINVDNLIFKVRISDLQNISACFGFMKLKQVPIPTLQ